MAKKCKLRCDIVSSRKDKSRDELIDELVDRILEIEKLKRKLRRYENPHTPPSRDERKSKHRSTAPSGLGVGKKSGYNVWIFRSTRFVFYCIRKERNRKVLDEILGYNYSGCIICDGLSAYKEYTKYLQR